MEDQVYREFAVSGVVSDTRVPRTRSGEEKGRGRVPRRPGQSSGRGPVEWNVQGRNGGTDTSGEPRYQGSLWIDPITLITKTAVTCP